MDEVRRFLPPEINQVEALTAKLMELNRELTHKNQLLEESELARKNMFSHITHDLRAPISVIRGAAERLSKAGVDGDECARLAKIITTRSMDLDRLVQDLYFTILMDQPEFSLKLARVDIVPLLEEYYISMEESGKLDRRRGSLLIPEGFSFIVNIDPQCFVRVLDNLFANALRHTEEGDVITLGCDSDEHKTVDIYIRDSGAGIPPAYLPHIFERTFSGSQARTPGESGGGFGLSISKTIMDKHGGSIRCDSVYGEGAIFTLTLPLAG